MRGKHEKYEDNIKKISFFAHASENEALSFAKVIGGKLIVKYNMIP